MLRNPPKPELTGLEPHQVVLRPLISEKSVHKAERLNQYAFEVNVAAGKADIRKAVEYLFEVKVVRVNIQNRRGKVRRVRMRSGATRQWKKAVVTLDSEYRINLF